MLLKIRERAQGWVAWAIVILISIPFALWGIQSYLGVGAEPVVARVNGTEITDRQLTQNVQRTRADMRARLGEAYDPALFEGSGLRERVLEQMIQAQIVLGAARRLGLRVADAALRSVIAAEPVFQLDGRFDRATYNRALQYQGLTPGGFEQNLRLSLLQDQLERALRDTAFATAAEVERGISLVRQQRDIAYLRLPVADFVPSEPPAEDALRAFHDENPNAFRTPEQVRVSYLLLSTETLGADESVSETDVRALYEERLETLRTPERRALRHILLAVPADADAGAVAEQRERALAVRQRIVAGEDFAEVATEVSEDRVSAQRGGELGSIERGLLDPSLDDVAFALAVGELSEPVRSRFGYHLVEVTAIVPSAVPSFEEVAEDLRAELRARLGEGMFYDQAEHLATLVYEVPDSLIPAAEALGLEIRTSDWFDRSGGEGLFAHPRVLAAAFSEDVLRQGNNSELIEPDGQQMQALVLRLEEHRPESLRPFDDVRDEIAERFVQRQAAEAAMDAAAALAARIEQGESFAEVAEGRALEEPGLVERQAAQVPGEVLRAAFELPRPTDQGVSVTTAMDAAGDAFVVRVSAVRDGSLEQIDASSRAGEARVLAQSLGRAQFSEYVAGLERRAKITRRPLSSEVSEVAD